MDQQTRAAIKRLNSDWQEIQRDPVACVSAMPLEKDIFEWHCNFDFNGTIFHVILYFPKVYPAKSPSAEFVPGFEYSGGATKRGPKGGIQVCLSIFSDFAMYHTEWANEKGTGWSPSYTVQTVLLNLLSFLVETAYDSSSSAPAQSAAKAFTCSDCGHTHATPVPALSVVTNAPKDAKNDEITCYATRSKHIANATKEIFGFGITKSGNDRNPNYVSPCEYITQEGFETLKASGKVESVMREEIHYFIPLYINPTHGKSIHTIMYPGVFSLMPRDIQQCFEKSLITITGGKQFDHSLILNVLPKLMNSAVVSFMNGTTHTSERALRGYFAFHRLFLWACEQYKLVPKINTKLEDFIKNPGARSKANTPNIGDWLTYLSVSPNFGWEHASIAYLKENMLRNVMWYLKEQPNLAKTDDAAVNARRFEDTFRLTKVSRDLLAFQVLFLDIAKPKDLSLQQVAERYDANNGLPTDEMESQMKAAVAKIKTVQAYPDYFNIIKVPLPPKEKFLELLIDNVRTAATLDGYYFKNDGGSGRGGYGGGRGGRGR